MERPTESDISFAPQLLAQGITGVFLDKLHPLLYYAWWFYQIYWFLISLSIYFTKYEYIHAGCSIAMASLQWDGKILLACCPLTRPITTCGKRSLVLLWPVRAPRWTVQHPNPHKWGESFTAKLMVVNLKEQLVFWVKVRQNVPSSQHTSQRNIPWYRETNNNFLKPNLFTIW